MSKIQKTISALVVLVIFAVGTFLFFTFFKPMSESTKKGLVGDLVIKDDKLPQERRVLIEQQYAELKARVEKDSQDFNAWIDVGVIKKSVNDFDGAKAAWLKAEDLRASSSLPFFNLGDLYNNFLNQPKEAEAAYLVALKNDPKWVSVYTDLADLYLNKFSGREADAEKLVVEGLKNTENDPTLLAYAGSFYKRLGNFSEAVRYYEELLKVKPDDQTIKDEIVALRKKI